MILGTEIYKMLLVNLCNILWLINLIVSGIERNNYLEYTLVQIEYILWLINLIVSGIEQNNYLGYTLV